MIPTLPLSVENTPVIGLIGRYGVGKDHAARGRTRVSLADDLKILAERVLKRPLDKRTDREHLQRLAAAGRGSVAEECMASQIRDRFFDEHPRFGLEGDQYWVNRVNTRCMDFLNAHPETKIAVPDIRHPSDIAWARKVGRLFLVAATPTDLAKRRQVCGYPEDDGSHPSEAFAALLEKAGRLLPLCVDGLIWTSDLKYLPMFPGIFDIVEDHPDFRIYHDPPVIS